MRAGHAQRQAFQKSMAAARPQSFSELGSMESEQVSSTVLVFTQIRVKERRSNVRRPPNQRWRPTGKNIPALTPSSSPEALSELFW